MREFMEQIAEKGDVCIDAVHMYLHLGDGFDFCPRILQPFCVFH